MNSTSNHNLLPGQAFAEGWYGAGHGDAWQSAWAAARFEGEPTLIGKLRLTWRIYERIVESGLKRGCGHMAWEEYHRASAKQDLGATLERLNADNEERI